LLHDCSTESEDSSVADDSSKPNNSSEPEDSSEPDHTSGPEDSPDSDDLPDPDEHSEPESEDTSEPDDSSEPDNSSESEYHAIVQRRNLCSSRGQSTEQNITRGTGEQSRGMYRTRGSRVQSRGQSRTRGSRVPSRGQSRTREEFRRENIARETTGQSRLENSPEPDYNSEPEDSPDSDDLSDPDEPESSDVSGLVEGGSGVLNTSLDVLPYRSFGGNVTHHWDCTMSRLWTSMCTNFFSGSNICVWCGKVYIQAHHSALRLIEPFGTCILKFLLFARNVMHCVLMTHLPLHELS
jgi:hypothetical protein